MPLAAPVGRPTNPRPVAAPPRPGGGPPARRATRPLAPRGASGGVLAFLLAMAAVLAALGAGFFGLASLSREGIATPLPTPAATTPPEPRPTATAVPQPAVVLTNTPEPTATPEPSATPEPPTPSPVPPTPSPVRPSPTPPPPTAVPTPRPVAVPLIRGRTLEQAQAALRSAGLTATVRGINANVDKDVVADQAPDANALLPPGGTVTIMVGTGSTAIPDVANMPRDQAVRTLQNNSFRVTQRQRRDQRVPEGVAIDTRPAAGVISPRNSEVELFISQGR